MTKPEDAVKAAIDRAEKLALDLGGVCNESRDPISPRYIGRRVDKIVYAINSIRRVIPDLPELPWPGPFEVMVACPSDRFDVCDSKGTRILNWWSSLPEAKCFCAWLNAAWDARKGESDARQT